MEEGGWIMCVSCACCVKISLDETNVLVECNEINALKNIVRTNASPFSPLCVPSSLYSSTSFSAAFSELLEQKHNPAAMGAAAALCLSHPSKSFPSPLPFVQRAAQLYEGEGSIHHAH